jgi:hypothetical protein
LRAIDLGELAMYDTSRTQKLVNFLESQSHGPLCDDCIAPKAGLSSAAAAGSCSIWLYRFDGKILRYRAQCSECKRQKLVTVKTPY